MRLASGVVSRSSERVRSGTAPSAGASAGFRKTHGPPAASSASPSIASVALSMDAVEERFGDDFEPDELAVGVPRPLQERHPLAGDRVLDGVVGTSGIVPTTIVIDLCAVRYHITADDSRGH